MAAVLCLPLGPPLVQSYLFHAFPLAILAAQGDRALPWILSTFVQLYCRPGDTPKFYVHPLSPAPRLGQVLPTHCPWLEILSLDPGCLDTSPAACLTRCLGRGLYAQVDVDYGRLPGDGRDGFVHEVLVCGVDADEAAFQILGYDPAGRFRTRWVTAAALTAAIAAARRGGGGDGAHEDPRWFLYRVSGDAAASLDVDAVVEQLWDYVEAADSSRRHRAVWPPTDGVWGVATLHGVAAALRNGVPAAALVLPLRVLWEHKRLMALRLAHLEAVGHLDPDRGASAGGQRLAADAWQLRLACLRRGVDSAGAGAGRRPPAASGLAARVDDLATRELDLYGDVLARLDAGSGGTAGTAQP